MDKNVNREAIKKYFKPFPKWVTWFIIIGILLTLIGANGGTSALKMSGFFILAIGILGAWNAMRKLSDKEVDEYIAKDISRAKIKSIQKASIDESELVGDPLTITGPGLWNNAGLQFLHKKGKDNIIRFTPINITLLLMTEHQIISYQTYLDLTTGNFLNESTDEYFYKDVVSVATKTMSKSYTHKKLGVIQLNEAETFTLTTSGGTSVEVFLKDRKLIEALGLKGGEIPTTSAEKAIQVVRKMLREKKQN